MKYKLIIFDLDGTLIDSLEGIAYSMNEVLRKNNLPIHSNEEYKMFIGEGRKALVSKALPIELRDGDLTKYNEEMRESYAKYWDKDMKAYEGIYELLDYLVEKGIKIAVNTNKDQEGTELLIEKFFSKYDFIDIVGRSDEKERKPHHQGAFKIMEKAGVSRSETLFVGDTETDIKTAENAGVDFVGVLWGFRAEEDLKKCGMRKLIKKPLELIKN